MHAVSLATFNKRYLRGAWRLLDSPFFSLGCLSNTEGRGNEKEKQKRTRGFLCKVNKLDSIAGTSLQPRPLMFVLGEPR